MVYLSPPYSSVVQFSHLCKMSFVKACKIWLSIIEERVKFTQGDSSTLQQPDSWGFTGPFSSLFLFPGICKSYSAVTPAEVSKLSVWAIYECNCICLKETGNSGSHLLLWILKIFGGLGTEPTASFQSSSPFSMPGQKTDTWKITRSLTLSPANSFLLPQYSNLT